MSRWLDHADALRDFLEDNVIYCSAAPLVPVIVDRGKDLTATIAKSVAKAGGAAVIILWEGAKNAEPASRLLRMGANYSVLCITKPVVAGSAVACDDLCEAVAAAMHDWVPADTPNIVAQRLAVTEITIQPSASFMIYEISAEVLRLPIPS